VAEDRFPAIWMPPTEYRDLRSLLLHRHQWVRMRTRVQNALHAIVLAHGIRRGHTLWNRDGQALLASLPLAPYTADRRSELQGLYQHLQAHLDRLDKQVKHVADERPRATLLMTHPGVGPVTALATDVFVGDPTRFLGGKALASYVGMIPREYSSGPRQRLGALSKQGNPFLRFLWCEAAAHAVRRDPDLQRFYRRKAVQKGFASGSCCAIRSSTRSSAVVAWRGRRKRGVCAGMPVLALVLVRE
jgi:transposase